MVFVFEYLLAFLTAASLASSHNRLIQTVCNLCIVLIFNPLLEHSLELIGAALASLCFGHKACKTLFDFAVSNLHTKTILAEVLKQ